MIRLDATPNKRRASLSPSAYCVHCILTSPNAKKHGLSGRQIEIIEACKRVMGDADRERLRALGHAGFEPLPPLDARPWQAPEDRA